jgi:hypothetical protein
MYQRIKALFINVSKLYVSTYQSFIYSRYMNKFYIITQSLDINSEKTKLRHI